MTAIEFRDNDRGYLDWTMRHPNGFVLQSWKVPSQDSLILHSASCRSITQYQKRQSLKSFTGKDRKKICASSVAELEIWVRARGFEIARKCSFCRPREQRVTGVGKFEQTAVDRLVAMAYSTAAQSGGDVLSVRKSKEVRFANKDAFRQYISKLLEKQNHQCAVTGIRFAGGENLCESLDRIDSDGHYEEGNLQIVCRFINRWKADGDDKEFRRLIALVRVRDPIF